MVGTLDLPSQNIYVDLLWDELSISKKKLKAVEKDKNGGDYRYEMESWIDRNGFAFGLLDASRWILDSLLEIKSNDLSAKHSNVLAIQRSSNPVIQKSISHLFSLPLFYARTNSRIDRAI